MNIHKVIAIFDELRLDEVEQTLIQHGVKGFTLHPVRGRGHYFDSFNRDHLTKHIQMEVYTSADQSRLIAQLILDAAHMNVDSEGLVTIVSVNDLLWIHTKKSATDADFHIHM
ncbi:MAG: P-II family nitrogen regulator [Pseudomonadota bacterium]|jgi:nitrogen regulatory protein P-II 1|nr:P-II family nitrogen regulator [Pseudomonadota bacterium]